MPRNIRSKAAPLATNKRRRGSDSSSLDLSSEGGYSALEEVSDSEDDDEEGVDAVEEKHIIKDVTKGRASSPRPQVQSEEEDADEEGDEDDDDADGDDEDDDEDGDDLEINEEDLIAEDGSDDDEDEDSEGVDLADDGASWNGVSESDAVTKLQTPVKRQVRFADVPDSDSDSTATDTSAFAKEFFPDIFVEQNALDPGFRREIEHESDSSVSSSFWDYASGYGQNAAASAAAPFSDDDLVAAAFADPIPGSAPADAAAAVEGVTGGKDKESDESEDNLDGYETDGDTTEDDEPEPLPVRKRPARRVQSVDSDEDSTDSDSEVDLPLRHRRGHPRARRFAVTLKGNRPVAVIHPVSGKMVIFTPEKPREVEVMSDVFPFSSLDAFPPHSGGINSSPLVGNSTSVMMGAMFASHTFGDYIHSQHIGPVEAFFPSLSSDTFINEDSDFSGELGDDDDGESNLRLEDFIKFDHDETEERGSVDELMDTILAQSDCEALALGGRDVAEEQDDDATTPIATSSVAPTSRRASFAASSSIGPMADDDEEAASGDNAAALPPLLAHFSKNVDTVGAFRRNQINQQLILSSKATPDSLALSGPYTMGTLRGIKSGSFGAVASPLTPLRRPKRPSVSFSGNTLESAAQKRKASSVASDSSSNHKRQRSISEVKDLLLG